ncbi:MAG: hypothetical protein H8E55_41185 [Pelagibacterales bacterium]|nr:hypothetical protein [Pelagibacterales bacterium]
MYDLIITPTEIKELTGVYDEGTEQERYTYDKVDDLAIHLGSSIKFEGKVTFERIFDLILENKDFYTLVFHSQMGGHDIADFIEDYNKTPESIEDDVEFLEIYASGDSTTYHDSTKDLNFGVDFHGWGKWDPETKTNKGPISISFSSLSDCRKLELKLKENADFVVTPKSVAKLEDYLKYDGTFTYTWYDILSAILYDISWYGAPASRDIALENLTNLRKELNE